MQCKFVNDIVAHKCACYRKAWGILILGPWWVWNVLSFTPGVWSWLLLTVWHRSLGLWQLDRISRKAR